MDFRKDEVKIGKSKYNIIACSVMGQGKLENQDSYDYYFDDNQIIITVADGLGSATFSKEGSSKIVKLLIDILKENIGKESIPLELLNRWKTALGGNLSLYDTTIKFIHIKEDSINYGGVGDGWIAINEKENFISLCASNTFSNQTDSILSFDLRNKFINRENEVEAVQNMLISTDGFSEDIEKENGKSFMTDIYNQILEDKAAFEEDIKNTLSNWPVESNRDDKTVVFIHREEA